MRAGRLTEEIAIERAAGVIDGYGTPSLTWTALARVRAEKVEQTTTEYIRNFGASNEELERIERQLNRGIPLVTRM